MSNMEFGQIKEQFHNLSKLYQCDLNRLKAMVRYLLHEQTPTFKQDIFTRDIRFLKDSLNSRRQFLGNILLSLQQNSFLLPAYNIAQTLSLRFQKEEELINSLQAEFDSGQLPLKMNKDTYGSSIYYRALKLYGDSFELSRNAHHYLDEIAYYHDLFDLGQFNIKGVRIGTMRVLEISKKEGRIKGGVVIIPGIFLSIEHFRLLAMRLATRNHYVLLLDLPGHSMAYGEFNIGIMVERIYSAISYMRNFVTDKIAIVGHSMGGIGAMFAAAGYSYETEKTIDELFGRLSSSFAELEKYSDSEKKLIDELKKNPAILANCYKELDHGFREFASDFDKIRETIENAIKRNPVQRLGSDRIVKIDAIVSLSAPDNIQRAMPPTKVFRKLGFKKTRFLVNLLFNKPVSMGKSPISFKPRRPPFWYGPQKSVPREKLVLYNPSSGPIIPDDEHGDLGQLRIRARSFNKLMDYVESVQNPEDYMKLLLLFSEDGSSQVIHDFVDGYVKKIPKLFIYGGQDNLLRPMDKGNKERINSVYKLMGNTRIKFFANLDHYLVGIPDVKTSGMQGITAIPVVEEIVRFLDQRLR